MNLNEFMLIEKFIRKYFKTSTCLLEAPKGSESLVLSEERTDLVPSMHSTRLLVTQEQIWKEVAASGSVV